MSAEQEHPAPVRMPPVRWVNHPTRPADFIVRREVVATPVRCAGRDGSGFDCGQVITVEHPLPSDWHRTRCPRCHPESKRNAA